MQQKEVTNKIVKRNNKRAKGIGFLMHKQRTTNNNYKQFKL